MFYCWTKSSSVTSDYIHCTFTLAYNSAARTSFSIFTDSNVLKTHFIRKHTHTQPSLVLLLHTIISLLRHCSVTSAVENKGLHNNPLFMGCSMHVFFMGDGDRNSNCSEQRKSWKSHQTCFKFSFCHTLLKLSSGEYQAAVTAEGFAHWQYHTLNRKGDHPINKDY